MKTTSLLAVALLAAGLPVFAAQPPAETTPSAPAAASPNSPQSTQQPGTQPETSPGMATPSTPGRTDSGTTATSPESSAATAQVADLKPVSGQLVSKLDSKTAKTGDDVVIETQSAVRTSDGMDIPKGSKLTGHVVAVQPSGGQSPNSQVAVNIDKAELKGGQTVPIHSEIQAIGSTDTASAGGSSAGSSAMGRSSGSGMGSGSASSEPGSNANNSAAGSGNVSGSPGYAPGYTPGTTASNGPTAGTIVARNGQIAIRTTSMPGILLANNAPGEHDPRMMQASGILLGAKKDVQLESGTKVVVGVAGANNASSTGAGGAGRSAAAAPSGGTQ